jgi:hypothetical protein
MHRHKGLQSSEKQLCEQVCYDLVILSSYGLLFPFNAVLHSHVLPPSFPFVIAHSANKDCICLYMKLCDLILLSILQLELRVNKDY